MLQGAHEDLEFVRAVVHQRVRQLRLPWHLMDDLVGAGALALVRARERFEDGHGTTFYQYAVARVQGSVIDELRAHDLLPRSLRREYEAREESFQPTVSLDSIEGFDPPSAEHSPELQAIASGETQRLYAAIDELPERLRFVIRESLAGRRFQEIGEQLGVTESRISQLYKEAVQKLIVLFDQQPPPTPRGDIRVTTPPIQTLMSKAAASPTARTRKLGEQLAKLLDELEQRLVQESEELRLQREIAELERQLAEKRAKLPQATQMRAPRRVPAGTRPRNGVCPDCEQGGLANVGSHRSKAHGWVNPNRAKKSA